MKVVVLSDTHIGSRGDSVVFDSYFHKFFDQIFIPYLEKNKIDRIVHLGDLVDRRKYINFNVLNKFRVNFLHRIENLGCRMDVIVGNHDTYHKNSNNVNAIQELLGGWENVHIFTDPHTMQIGKKKILLVPWISPENYELSMTAIRESDADILMGHLEINGFLMHYGAMCENGLERHWFSKFDMVLSGHFHHKSSEGNIHYLGSPYEMNFGDINDPKGFHVLDTDTGDVEFIQNPFRIFYSLNYDDRGMTMDTVMNQLSPVSRFEGAYVRVNVLTKTNPYYFDKFIDLISQVSPANLKIMEEFQIEEGADDLGITGQDTLTILNNHVDSSEADYDKTEIKNKIRDIYVEATSVEFV